MIVRMMQVTVHSLPLVAPMQMAMVGPMMVKHSPLNLLNGQIKIVMDLATIAQDLKRIFVQKNMDFQPWTVLVASTLMVMVGLI